MHVHLVRHGEAAAGWGSSADPGLSPLGMRQAESVADRLRDLLPSSVLSSPLLRARETAAPLAELWGRSVRVDGAFGEIPSPTHDLAERAAWLPGALAGTWDDLDEQVGRWRSELLASVRGLSAPTVVFTHFVAINAVVSEAMGSRAVTSFLPANASVTVIEVASNSGALSVVSLGDEAATAVG